MSGHPLKPLHMALYQRLTGDSALMALVTGVYDYVPADAAFPYLVLEDSDAVRWGLLGANAHRCEVKLDAYSRQGGRKEIMEILNALQVLLHHQPLTVTGFTVAVVEVSNSDTEWENDGITTRARAVVRCQLVEAA